MPYTFDDQRDPLISIHIHGWLTDADFGQFSADLERLDERGTPYVLVLNCSGLRVPELGQISRLRSCFTSATAPRYQRGLACVVTTPMLRGTIRAVCQARPMQIPFAVVEDAEAGHRWAAERLELSQAMSSQAL